MIYKVVQYTFLFMVIGSWLYWMWAFLMAERFVREEQPPKGPLPPVSILKPVRGEDFQSYQNFASFCRQDYPRYEILFGVLDHDDPVVSVIRRLQRDFPDVPIRLLVARPLGQNPKVSILHELERNARYDVLVIADSDMRVGPDYLRRLTAHLHEPGVGLVTTPYRGCQAENLPALMEALHIGCGFIPSVLVCRNLFGMGFALGATILLRREALQKAMGGFHAIRDHLADDFQLGLRVSRAGYGVRLVNYFVDYVLGRVSLRSQWERELRWARTIRCCRQWGYMGLLFTFSTPLSLLYLLITGTDGAGGYLLVASMIIRSASGWRCMVLFGGEVPYMCLFLIPLREMMSFFIWLQGLAGQKVRWRGRVYTLMPDGRIQALEGAMEDAEAVPQKWTSSP